jgi:hypothetical protein
LPLAVRLRCTRSSSQTGSKSANTNPSRSTISPFRTSIG